MLVQELRLQAEYIEGALVTPWSPSWVKVLLNQLKSGKIWQDAHVAMSAPAALRKQKHFIKFASRPNNTKYHSSIYHNMA